MPLPMDYTLIPGLPLFHILAHTLAHIMAHVLAFSLTYVLAHGMIHALTYILVHALAHTLVHALANALVLVPVYKLLLRCGLCREKGKIIWDLTLGPVVPPSKN